MQVPNLTTSINTWEISPMNFGPELCNCNNWESGVSTA